MIEPPQARSRVRVLIMGILNVTPDSFSDGGVYLDPEEAAAHAERLAADGADIIDVGAESTRPGALAVPLDEEWGRLEPLLRQLAKAQLPIPLSVDTRKPEIMLRAADLGVAYINDVAGGAPIKILERLAGYSGLQYIAMHMNESPPTMQQDPLRGAAAVRAVDRFFAKTWATLGDAGFAPDRMWLDPGIGFGKGDSGNMQLLATLPRWAQTYKLCVGVSRKSFIGRALAIASPSDRDGPSKMLELGLAINGVRMIRTHAVKPLRRLVDLLQEDADA